MENTKTHITIQEVAKLFKCTTRTVYRRLDAIDTFQNHVDKGHAVYEVYQNGNNRRLFDKEWIESILAKEQKVSAVKSSDKSEWITVIENQLNLKDEQIKAKDEQIDQLAMLLHKMEQRTLELEAHFHLNNMENSPRLTTTKENKESNTNAALSIDIDELNNSDKTMSEWLKDFNSK